MFSFLPAPVKGITIILLVTLNTIFWLPILVFGAVLKLVIPLPAIQKWVSVALIACATNWVTLNNFFMWLFLKVEWVVTGSVDLNQKSWYFVNCNHQSWSDIPVVQKILNREVPMLKFFLKKDLIWVPFLGICWWALDFPFMKRSSPSQIKKNPSLAGKDLETTQKACEKFKSTPVSVFNFIEGTRFTPEKHAQQESPFVNLLKPKAGGTAFVLGSMGEQMHTMLDVSIIYPGAPDNGPWSLVSGKISKVVVHLNEIEIPREFLGRDYANDAEFKSNFQTWLNELWVNKDKLLSDLKLKYEQS